MNRLEYLAATAILRWLRAVFSLLPVDKQRVVLASPRHARLEGNLRHLYQTMRQEHPELRYVLLLEPYSYNLFGKLGYLLRLVRGMYYLCTSGLFIVDNAYLPIHVAPHRPETTVVQVWHAAGALKRFGMDTRRPPRDPERRFLHRHYDYVIASSERTRTAYSRALRTPLERVLALGAPRTDLFFDEEAMARARQRLLERHPNLAGRRVVLYAPTFRGRGGRKRVPAGLDAKRLRQLLPREYAIVLKSHPNLGAVPDDLDAYDAVIDPTTEINHVLGVTDVLVTDYSSVIFEWALLRRPLVLLTADLEAYEVDPGLYLDYRTEMIGVQVTDTDEVAAAILSETFDVSGYDAFIERHLGSRPGGASLAFVRRFLPAERSAEAPEGASVSSDTLRSHVSHD